MSVVRGWSLSLCESSPLVNGPRAASLVPAGLAEHPGRRASVPRAPRMLDEPDGSCAAPPYVRFHPQLKAHMAYHSTHPYQPAQLSTPPQSPSPALSVPVLDHGTPAIPHYADDSRHATNERKVDESGQGHGLPGSTDEPSQPEQAGDPLPLMRPSSRE